MAARDDLLGRVVDFVGQARLDAALVRLEPAEQAVVLGFLVRERFAGDPGAVVVDASDAEPVELLAAQPSPGPTAEQLEIQALRVELQALRAELAQASSANTRQLIAELRPWWLRGWLWLRGLFR